MIDLNIINDLYYMAKKFAMHFNVNPINYESSFIMHELATTILCKDDTYTIDKVEIPTRGTFTKDDDASIFNDFLNTNKLRQTYVKALIKYPTRTFKSILERKHYIPSLITQGPPYSKILDEFVWKDANNLLNGDMEWANIYNLWKLHYIGLAIPNIIQHGK